MRERFCILAFTLIVALVPTCARSQGSYTPPAQVANAAALQTFTNYGISVIRNDVDALYTDTGASCTQPDGGWQIQPATGHCWQTDISRGAPVTLWGAVNTDQAADGAGNVSAFNAAFAAAATVGGTTITVPGGGCFRINNLVNIRASYITLQGTASGSCIDLDNATSDGIVIGIVSSTVIYNDVVSNIRFKNAQNKSLGASFHSVNAFGVIISNPQCGNKQNTDALFYNCIAVDQGITTTINNPFVYGEGHSGISFGCLTGTVSGGAIHGGNINFQHSAAIEACNVSGLVIDGGLNTDFNYYGLYGHPASGAQVSGIYAANVFFDKSQGPGVLFDASPGGVAAGRISENVFVPSVWIASSGMPVPVQFAPLLKSPIANTLSPNLYANETDGKNNLLIHNYFFATIFNGASEGIFLTGGQNNQFGGITTANCQSDSSATCAGMNVAGLPQDWSWDGRAGGISGIDQYNQKWGVYVANTATNYYIIKGDLHGNITGGLSDNGTGANKLTGQILQ